MKAIALDDEPLPLRLLRTFSAQTGFIDLVATFTSPVEANKFIEQNKIDLLFLDIQMPGISGIDFLKAIPGSTLTIFTTAFSEYAVEGFNLKAVDYLLKPFEYSRFLQAAVRARELYEHKEMNVANEALLIKADYGLTRVPFTDILYIEGLNNYVKIYLPNKRSLLVRMSMKDMMDKLPVKNFMRVHRSYIVPLRFVASVRNRTIDLGHIQLPVGVNYLKDVQAFFNGLDYYQQ